MNNYYHSRKADHASFVNPPAVYKSLDILPGTIPFFFLFFLHTDFSRLSIAIKLLDSTDFCSSIRLDQLL